MKSLTFAEGALFEFLKDGKIAFVPDGRVLVAGNRSGELPLALSMKLGPGLVNVHAFDVHHARQIRDRFVEAKMSADNVVSTAYVPEGPYSLAFFQTTPRSMPAELVLDQIEDIYANLADGAILYASIEGDYGEALNLLKKVFPKVGVLEQNKHVTLFRCVKKGELVKRRSFEAVFPASLPGGTELSFLSLPGCFCHRRPDAGGLALAEVASREVRADDRILDMGCGCGLVGLLLADAQRRLGNGTPETALIDSHARAVEAAHRNAAAFGLDAKMRFLLADDGLPRGEVGAFDVFVGNPPYYSDYRIAEIFLETAYRALRKGGLCFTVVKTATGLKALQEKYFGSAEIIPRRGYAVLKSVR